MDVSPQHLREVEFTEKWRGYNPDQVDELLERTATTLADLQERLRATEDRATSAERRVLETSDDDVRRALVLAQRTADAAVAEAAEEAERRLADADQRARAIQAEADERAALELEELARRRTALESEATALAAFVEEHRARIGAEVREHLAWLEAPGRLVLPDPPAVVEPLALAMQAPAGSDGGPEALVGTDAGAEGDGGPPTEALALDDLPDAEADADAIDVRQADAEGSSPEGEGADGPIPLPGAPRAGSGRPALDSAAADDPFFSELREAVADDPVDPRDALEGPDLVDADAGAGRGRRARRLRR